MARGPEDVLSQMIDAGVPELPKHLDICSKIRRFGRGKRGWYTLHEHTARNGSRFITGAFGYWGRVDATRVAADLEEDAEGRAERREKARLAAEAEQRRRRDLAARAAMLAGERWHAAERQGISTYLRRKHVEPESVRFEPDGTILVPMLRYDFPRERALVGLQAIKPDGTKLFGRGTAKQGAAVRLGAAVLEPQNPILLTEGLATGLSLRMATRRRWPVFVCFDAGNLPHVARIVRRLYPSAYILVCADDDFATWGNPGRAKAWHAATVAKNADIATPYFANRGDRRLTDWNDLHVEHGLAACTRQLDSAIKHAQTYGARRIAA